MATATITPLPTRVLGRTGYRASILGLGGVCYNFLDDAGAAAVVNRAIDLGINYIDTAHGYKDSERKIGLVMAERRSEVFLATKTQKRDRDGAASDIEESFKRLRTDVIDCVQIHAIETEKELATLTGPNGALKLIEELRAAGRIRFVGVTSHIDPTILAKALEVYPFDTVLASLGAVHAAVKPFYESIMPVAKAHDVGVVAMKVLAYGFLKHRPEDSIRYTIGLPGVACSIVGVDNLEQLERNVAAARAFVPMTDAERTDLLTDARRIYEARKNEAWFICEPKAEK